MHARMRFFLVAAAALSLSATVSLPRTASAQPNGFRVGPYGGCPAGYHRGAYDQRCWLNGGPRPAANGFRVGPYGGCPAGYHRGAYEQRCWRN